MTGDERDLDEAARVIAESIDSVVKGAPLMAAAFKLYASAAAQAIAEDYRTGRIDLLTAQRRTVALVDEHKPDDSQPV